MQRGIQKARVKIKLRRAPGWPECVRLFGPSLEISWVLRQSIRGEATSLANIFRIGDTPLPISRSMVIEGGALTFLSARIYRSPVPRKQADVSHLLSTPSPTAQMSCCSQKKSHTEKPTPSGSAQTKTCCGQNVSEAAKASVKREEGGISFCECNAISACACAADECQCVNCVDHKL